METESRDSGDIEGTEVMRYWGGRGVQHDPRFWFRPLEYWWNTTGTTGTGMVIDSVGACAECEGPWHFQVDVQKAVRCDRWELRK